MFFNSNFSFGPPTPHGERQNSTSSTGAQTLASHESEQLSPSTKVQPIKSPRKLSLRTSFMSTFKRGSFDRSSLRSPESSYSIFPTRYSSVDSESTSPLSLPKMSFTTDGYEEYFGNFLELNHNKDPKYGGLARPLKMASSGPPQAKMNEVSVGKQRSNTQIKSVKTTPKRSRKPRPPPLKLGPFPVSESTGRHSGFSHKTTKSSLNNLPAKSSSLSPRRHSEVADSLGVSMLANSLFDSDSDEVDVGCDPMSVSNAAQARLYGSPIPTIHEYIETASTSSISTMTYDPYSPRTPRTPGRKGSCSTIPTSASGNSLLEVPSTKASSVTSGNSSFLLDDCDSDEEDEEESTQSLAPSSVYPSSLERSGSFTAPRSRQSSIQTFFCRGPRASINNRLSIGLGSIADEDIDLEAGTEDLTHYPGIDELKKQISWLALRSPEAYGSDDDESDEECYHKQLASINNSSRTNSRRNSRNPSVCSAPAAQQRTPKPTWGKDTGSIVEPVRYRRERSRTASSECLVRDAMQELEKQSTAQGRSIRTEASRRSKVSTTRRPSAPLKDPRASSLSGFGIGPQHDNWNNMLWDDGVFGNVASLEFLNEDDLSFG
ncbi:hypothetical protein EDC01DRAFT_677867 [Geopyxis carbonaria]|nr:hypothetical protein EDC01DRAFT_677867 [Geopyxis carbonaria]